MNGSLTGHSGIPRFSSSRGTHRDAKTKGKTLLEELQFTEMMLSPPASPRALIADDQPEVLEALRLLLKAEGCLAEVVTSPAAVLESLKRKRFDILLMDLNYARDTTSGQ